jgi:hypothetical protein
MTSTRDKIAAAYKRGAVDMQLYLMSKQEPPYPKPDVERYLAELGAKPTVVRL